MAPVEVVEPRSDGSWTVVTSKGEIHTEHVVNCGGLWAREIGRMVGIELPVLAMEHMYLVTDEMPEVVAYNKERGHELPHAIDFKAEIYMRQERTGMVLGTYERAGVPWSPKTTSWDFGAELLQPDLDRIAPSLEIGYEHFPAMAKAGIKMVNVPSKGAGSSFAPAWAPSYGQSGRAGSRCSAPANSNSSMFGPSGSASMRIASTLTPGGTPSSVTGSSRTYSSNSSPLSNSTVGLPPSGSSRFLRFNCTNGCVPWCDSLFDCCY